MDIGTSGQAREAGDDAANPRVEARESAAGGPPLAAIVTGVRSISYSCKRDVKDMAFLSYQLGSDPDWQQRWQQ